MGVILREAEDADMHRIFVIASEAFAKNEPFFDIIAPEHWTEAGREVCAERWTKIKRTDPHTHYIAAVDDTSGIIVGFAKWNLYKDSFPETDKIEGGLPDFANDDERQYCLALLDSFIVPRNSVIERTKGNVASLDILAIHPEHQRRGVGDALVKWGLNEADQLGIEACVESSVFGKGLYVKNGFVFQKDVVLEVPEKFKDRPVSKFAWLVRPKIQHS